MDLDDIISLNDAAAELGISKETLRTQWRRGRFAAKLFGNTLITTRQETERYRRESLGNVGRPMKLTTINDITPAEQYDAQLDIARRIANENPPD